MKAMKINDPHASLQSTRRSEDGQGDSPPLARLERPRSDAALQGLADLSTSRRHPRNDAARHRRSASHSGELPNPDLLAPGVASIERRAPDPADEPAPKRHKGDRDPSSTLTRSLSVGDPRGEPAAATLPFAELTGKDRAEQLDRDWGTLQGARVKNGKRQIHAWEEGLHPARIVVPVGNPHGCDLQAMIDLEAIKAGTPMLWSVGMGAPLILGPHTLLPDPDIETGKERRLGHPALVAGDQDPLSGEWTWGKQARISGELRWDESRQSLYIINQSGRYSRHPDRGMDQMTKVAEQFEKSGLPVEIRLVDRKS